MTNMHIASLPLNITSHHTTCLIEYVNSNSNVKNSFGFRLTIRNEAGLSQVPIFVLRF